VPVVRVLNVVGFFLWVFFNALSGSGKISLQHVSRAEPTRINPSDWAFSIWILIYLLGLMFTVHQAVPPYSQRKAEECNKRIGLSFFFSCLFQVVWSLTWPHGLRVLNTLSVFGIGICISFAYRGADISRTFRDMVLEFICIDLFFSIYLAWISVACVLTLSGTVKYTFGWSGAPLSEDAWAVIAQVLIAIPATVMVVMRLDGVFGFTVTWAILGIAVGQRDSLPIFISSVVLGTALATISAIAVVGKIVRWKDRGYSPFLKRPDRPDPFHPLHENEDEHSHDLKSITLSGIPQPLPQPPQVSLRPLSTSLSSSSAKVPSQSAILITGLPVIPDRPVSASSIMKASVPKPQLVKGQPASLQSGTKTSQQRSTKKGAPV